MSGIDTSGNNLQIDPQALLGDTSEIKQEAKKSIEQALQMLGTVIAGNSLEAEEGVQELPPPSSSLLGGVTDLTLKIGLIQDALDQLMQEVSKLGIEQRMNQADQANQQQLEKIEEQAAEMQEAAAKAKEAEEKGNLFQMIGDWVNVAITAIAIAVTAVTAVVAGALTGGVAAVALGVAIAAMSVCLAAQITLAVDSTVAYHNDGQGFMSDDVRGAMETTAMVAGIIGSVASLVSGFAAIAKGVSAALSAAAKELGEEATKAAIQQAAKEGVKAGIKNAADEGMSAAAQAAKQAYQEAAGATMKTITNLAKTQFVGQLASQAVETGGTIATNEIKQDALAHERNAAEAEAAAKELQAVITMLKKMIEQLQEELEAMMDSAAQSLEVIFGMCDDSQTSMQKIHQSMQA